jgi:small neutral amino acid transporter SnatA (MarC family)
MQVQWQMRGRPSSSSKPGQQHVAAAAATLGSIFYFYSRSMHAVAIAGGKLLQLSPLSMVSRMQVCVCLQTSSSSSSSKLLQQVFLPAAVVQVV